MRAPLAILPMLLLGTLAFAQNLTIQCVVRDDRKRPIADLKVEELQITEDGKPVVLQGLKAGAGQAGRLSIVFDSGSADSAGLLRGTVLELLSALKERKVEIGVRDVKQATLLSDYSTDWQGVTRLIVGQIQRSERGVCEIDKNLDRRATTGGGRAENADFCTAARAD